MNGTISGLFYYPVKSLRGTEVSTCEMGPRGPRFDREWMLVDAANKFMTQRATPRLAQFQPVVDLGRQVLRVVRDPTLDPTSLGPLDVALDAVAGRRTVTNLRDTLEAIDCGPAAADWFSTHLGVRCRLVRMADDVHRRLDPKYVKDPAPQTGFSDAYPVLVVNEASLRELNSRLEQPVPMNRFRPNVVVRGLPPWVEDGWRRIRLGGLEFDAVKPCARCVTITTDQFSGAHPTGSAPLTVLASYRTLPELGAIFGMNLVPRLNAGTLRVGDALAVLPVER